MLLLYVQNPYFMTEVSCDKSQEGTFRCECIGTSITYADGKVVQGEENQQGCYCLQNGCHCNRELGFYKRALDSGCICHSSRIKKCNEGASFDSQHNCVGNTKADDFNCEKEDYALTIFLSGTILMAAIFVPLILKWYASLTQRESESEIQYCAFAGQSVFGADRAPLLEQKPEYVLEPARNGE